MAKNFYALKNGDFFQDWSNTELITLANDWSGVDAVLVTGGSLGANAVVLEDWTLARLVGQGFLAADHDVKGDWIA